WYYASSSAKPAVSVTDAHGYLYGVPTSAGVTAWNAWGDNDWVIERTDHSDFNFEGLTFYKWDRSYDASVVEIKGYDDGALVETQSYTLADGLAADGFASAVDKI